MTSTPPTLSTPPSRRAVRGQTAGSRVVRASVVMRVVCSHALGCGHPEQTKTVGEDDARRLRQPEPRTVQVGRLLVSERQDPARVIEAVVRAGQLFEVASDAMRLTELR